MNAARLRAALGRWHESRNTAPEPDVHHADAAGAEACECYVLAELIRLRDRLESARGPLSGGEVIAYLAPIIALARGDAQDRLAVVLGEQHVEVPGIVAHRRGSAA